VVGAPTVSGETMTINILLGVLAAAMLFASERHFRALLLRRRVLRAMYIGMDEAAQRVASVVGKPEPAQAIPGKPSGEHPVVRGVFTESAPELRREKRPTDPNPKESGRVDAKSESGRAAI
jgi:hypothetical protein